MRNETFTATGILLHGSARSLISRRADLVTLGAAGAFALTADGLLANVAPDGNAPVVDTVGAGDAFAAVLIAGLLDGWPLPLTLDRAQQLASAVCGQRGAVPDEPDIYRSLLGRWQVE